VLGLLLALRLVLHDKTAKHRYNINILCHKTVVSCPIIACNYFSARLPTGAEIIAQLNATNEIITVILRQPTFLI